MTRSFPVARPWAGLLLRRIPFAASRAAQVPSEGRGESRDAPQHSTMNPQRFSIVRLIPPYSGLSRLIGGDAARASALFRDKPG